ncbi:hypothetical protein ACIB24_07800 [Spongisporangium articulatum]|uniref:DUF4333 domain-containing protein n=1 Tax=Spongisporangium articulatum TaxID=3362603 RepID=A0ABW8AKQ6_9ACTN
MTTEPLTRDLKPRRLTAPPRWLVVTGLLLVLLAAGARLALAQYQHHGQQVRFDMLDIATRVNVPAGLTTVLRGDCPDVSGLVGCWTSTESPDALTAWFRAALTEAAGAPVSATCETLPRGHQPRSCLVAFRRDGGWVGVSIDTDGHLEDGRYVVTGSRVRLDAS